MAKKVEDGGRLGGCIARWRPEVRIERCRCGDVGRIFMRLPIPDRADDQGDTLTTMSACNRLRIKMYDNRTDVFRCGF